MTSNHRDIARKIAKRIMDRIEMARPTLGNPGGMPLLMSDIEHDVLACLGVEPVEEQPSDDKMFWKMVSVSDLAKKLCPDFGKQDYISSWEKVNGISIGCHRPALLTGETSSNGIGPAESATALPDILRAAIA